MSGSGRHEGGWGKLGVVVLSGSDLFILFLFVVFLFVCVFYFFV